MSERVIVDGIGFARDNFSPHDPTPRQQLFLDLNEEEGFYGGAAGGGKSDALLMAALQYVDRPNYTALLLRRTFVQLAMPGALMDRAAQWFRGAAEWKAETKTWIFPMGGRITFGYLANENDKYQYQSTEFHFIGFDELTHFTETQYEYMFSRLRKAEGDDIPIRMRSGSNPPNEPTGLWVKDRFIPDDFTPDDALEAKVWEKDYVDEETGELGKRYFVPARLDDNPHVDRVAYDKSLSKLDPVTRAQLRRGDWQISVSGDILFDWKESQLIVPWSRFMEHFDLKEQVVPHHWKLGVYMDWGTTREHPCVTGWFATAAENSPPAVFTDSSGNKHYVPTAGLVFWYRTHIQVTDVRATSIKEKISEYMLPQNENHRADAWEMSHEASSERNEFNHEDERTGVSLPFAPWQTGKTRGIEQLKSAIVPRNVSEPHPFNPGVMGCPQLIILVDDSQHVGPRQVLDGHDAGQSRIRSEAPAYHWEKPKSGDIPRKLEPHALYNDALDILRAAAANYFPQSEEKTVNEILLDRLKKKLPFLETQDNMALNEGSQIALAITRAREIKEMQEDYDIDEYGLETEASDVVDIGGGW